MSLLHPASMNSTFLRFLHTFKSHISEETPCCNVPHITSFFSAEKERERERPPHPEGWGEDERGGGWIEKRRGKPKKGEMGTQHIRKYEESKREQSRA